MPTLTIEYQTDAERLILEQALAYLQNIKHTALNAPFGTVLATCEQLALKEGRKLIADSLANAVQQRCQEADDSKKNGLATETKASDLVGS
jgi:hypothetical protein